MVKAPNIFSLDTRNSGWWGRGCRCCLRSPDGGKLPSWFFGVLPSDQVSSRAWWRAQWRRFQCSFRSFTVVTLLFSGAYILPRLSWIVVLNYRPLKPWVYTYSSVNVGIFFRKGRGDHCIISTSSNIQNRHGFVYLASIPYYLVHLQSSYKVY